MAGPSWTAVAAAVFFVGCCSRCCRHSRPQTTKGPLLSMRFVLFCGKEGKQKTDKEYLETYVGVEKCRQKERGGGCRCEAMWSKFFHLFSSCLSRPPWLGGSLRTLLPFCRTSSDAIRCRQKPSLWKKEYQITNKISKMSTHL